MRIKNPDINQIYDFLEEYTGQFFNPLYETQLETLNRIDILHLGCLINDKEWITKNKLIEVQRIIVKLKELGLAIEIEDISKPNPNLLVTLEKLEDIDNNENNARV